MPWGRKEVAIEIFSGPPPARQDSWKGTPLEEPEPAPPDVGAAEHGPEAPLAPAMEAIVVNHTPEEAIEEPSAAIDQPAEAPEPAPVGPPADEAQPFVPPTKEDLSLVETAQMNIEPETSNVEPEAALQASPAPAAAEGGSAARKELEDAIQRIEAHIMSERAARRAAEGALAQALQVASPAEPPGLSALTNLAQSELQVVLADLVNAQQAVQRAHGLVAALLAGAVLPSMVSNSVAQTPSISSTSLPPEAPVAVAPAAQPQPTATAATAAAVMPVESGEDGEAMKWTTETRSDASMARLKVRTGRRTPTTGPGESLSTPTGGSSSRKARGAGTPTAAARSPSVRSPARVKREAAAAMAAEKEPGDRFETREADAFMLRHSARWEPR